MTQDEALAMVTINPAKQLGIDKQVGSIETGKDGDLVVYDKFPLSDTAKVEKVFIDGKLYFDRDAEIAGRAAKEAEKQKLFVKDKAAAATAGGGGGGRGGRGGGGGGGAAAAPATTTPTTTTTPPQVIQ